MSATDVAPLDTVATGSGETYSQLIDQYIEMNEQLVAMANNLDAYASVLAVLRLAIIAASIAILIDLSIDMPWLSYAATGVGVGCCGGFLQVRWWIQREQRKAQALYERITALTDSLKAQ